MRFNYYSPRDQNGVSMIEALVALFVLSVGVLGMAGIQTQTLVESRASNSRAIAIQMADDLLDRMQANTPIRINSPAIDPYVVGWGSPPVAGTDCFAVSCTAAELAAFDLNQWKTTLASLLPQGDAQIFQSPGDPTQFGVLIGWSATQAKNEAQATAADTGVFAAAVSVRDAQGQVGTGVANVACLAGRLCHLVYIRP